MNTMTRERPVLDQTAAEAFANRVGEMLNAGATTVMMAVGHRLGLFDTMAHMPPATSTEIAERADLAERYVREWLAVMVVSGVVSHDPARHTYRLPPEHAACLTRRAPLGNLAVYAQHVSLLGKIEDRVIDCFETGAGTAYGDYPCFHQIMAEDSGETVTIYGDSWYAAKRWKYLRRVIHKAEIVDLPDRDPRENVRFVVTNLDLEAEQVYAIYRGRGDSENRIKELKEAVGLGRTSCHAFWANQFRVLLAATAFVLMQELRLRLKSVGLGSAQVETLRLHLLKIGGRIERSVRRVVIHLAEAHPWKHVWQKAALELGATVP